MCAGVQREHIHITFIRVCCYDCFIFIVKLLLCLIHQLNFIIGIYRKNHTYQCIGIICGFRHPLGTLERIPQGEGGTTVM